MCSVGVSSVHPHSPRVTEAVGASQQSSAMTCDGASAQNNSLLIELSLSVDSCVCVRERCETAVRIFTAKMGLNVTCSMCFKTISNL